MGAKKTKKVDVNEVNKKSQENDRLAGEYTKNKESMEVDLSNEKDLYCSLDESKCCGICREKNTKNGSILCSECIPYRQTRRGYKELQRSRVRERY